METTKLYLLTGESWTWFLLKFKECIGEVPNLAIITDRHPAIILACNTIFPNAFHGYCCRHLMMNCKMKSDKLQAIYWKTCKAYTPEEFQRRVSDLRGFRPEAYKKLEEAGFETWSRAMCPADRYNYMTSNSAESINNLTRHVRKAPITQLMEWYRALLQKWYCARRDKYKDSDANTLSDWATHKVMDQMQKSAHWNVLEIEYGRLYQVDDRRRVHQVDLTSRTCTCHKWQLSGIPCGHVIAVSRKIGCTVYSHLALGWFRKTTLYSTYQDLVYPMGEPSSWVRPDGLQVVKPPNMNFRTAGRPKNTDSIKSQGEEPIQYEAAYTNNYVRSQEYEATYTNNYVSTQEYEAAYNNKDGGSQGYQSTYNNMNGSSQGYEAAYTNFNSMFEQANINFGGQSQHPLPTMPLTFSQFNLGQSSQQTYSTWDSSWDPVNLADP
ncbi:transposase, MuDR, MULE transposase domain protein [Tanacetum coccineum]|uniref:Transposase, MuDR, MULE transposase domain protein n=1 Tax=Tanacetum coccineum TaxID=301880 RepID=A0ABQ5HXY2_9ASTR